MERFKPSPPLSNTPRREIFIDLLTLKSIPTGPLKS